MNEEINFEKYGCSVPIESLGLLLVKSNQHQLSISAQCSAQSGYVICFGELSSVNGKQCLMVISEILKVSLRFPLKPLSPFVLL